jgi:hypothetical protein
LAGGCVVGLRVTFEYIDLKTFVVVVVVVVVVLVVVDVVVGVVIVVVVVVVEGHLPSE